jgi:predicted O-methyltransferase YrrM
MTPQEFLSQITDNIGRFEKVAAFNAIPGYLTWHEGYALLSFAEQWPSDGDIVEIGSFKGKSTCYLAQGCATSGRGVVYAVDHFKGSPEHQKGGHEETREIVETGSTFDEFVRNLGAHGLGERVKPIVGDSTQAAAGWNGAIRMLFIDGDHSFDGTRTDFEAWFPHVSDTGLVCFHDYQNTHYLDGVTRFIDTQVTPRPDMRLIHRSNSLMTFMKVAA